MISLADAQARLLALALPVSTADVPLVEASGRWTATPVLAKRTQPARDLSAMDGYAVNFDDVPGPWQVIGESAAGSAFVGNLVKGEAVRIFTGAVLPKGANTVIAQEEIERDGTTISLAPGTPATRGLHLRKQGSDFQYGDVLIDAGSFINPARIGLVAMGGHANIAVRRRLRIAIISTGNELRVAGTETADDQIPSSNAPMLAALLRDSPVDVDDIGIVPDDQEALVSVFNDLYQYDIIVTLGGASVGDHDLVHPALIAAGASLDFWKVAIRPGKPLMAGRIGMAMILGLPGNPASAYVTAILFLLPLIAHMSGADDPWPLRSKAVLVDPLPANGVRTDHLRAKLHNGMVAVHGANDSAALAALAASNALIVRTPNAAAAKRGDSIEVIMLR
jgi:molybdopterin molybdotransferase